MNRKITKRLLMERAGLLNEVEGNMQTIFVANTHGETERVGNDVIDGISDSDWEKLDLEGVKVPESIVSYHSHDGIGKVIYDDSKTRDIMADIKYVDEQLFGPFESTSMNEETAEEGVEEEVHTEEVHTEEVDEGEMVADEASTSNEIKDFMEAHCSVDELGQIYEYLQEMMKRVAEQSKEDGKRYAKLAKKMARK